MTKEPYHPPRSHPWHRPFNDDANKHIKINGKKSIPYDVMPEERDKYLNYMKTKDFTNKKKLHD